MTDINKNTETKHIITKPTPEGVYTKSNIHVDVLILYWVITYFLSWCWGLEAGDFWFGVLFTLATIFWVVYICWTKWLQLRFADLHKGSKSDYDA